MATEHDQVDSGALATLVVVGVFATLSVALGVDALYRNENTKVSAERAGSASNVVHALVKEQRAALDAQPMPIDRAMSAVVLDLQRNPWSATPPMPEKDAGADAAVEEAADAGADAAADDADAGPPMDASGAPVPTAPTAAAPTPAAPTAAAPTAAAAPKAAQTPATPAAPTPAAPAAPTAVKPKAPVTPTPAVLPPPKPVAPAPAAPTPAAPAPAPPHG